MAKNFFNPFPKYLQVREMLNRRMHRDYDVGDQIPTEAALCKEFGVSRETVREALRGLEQDGIIERHRAKGTFFVQRMASPVSDRLTGMVEDFTALKLDTHAQVLETDTTSAPDELAQLSGAADDVFRIKRLRFFEGEPLVLHIAFLPLDVGKRVMPLDLKNVAITEATQQTLGIDSVEQRQHIEAITADTDLAQLLTIPIGAPVMRIDRIFQISKTREYMLFRSYYRADRYFYTLDFAQQKKTRKKP